MHFVYYSLALLVLSSFFHRSYIAPFSRVHSAHSMPHLTSCQQFSHLTYTPSSVCLLLPRSRGVIPLVPGSTGPGVRESRGPRVPGSTGPGVRESRCVHECDACCSITPIQEIGPRPPTRKRKVSSISVVISLVGTISSSRWIVSR